MAWVNKQSDNLILYVEFKFEKSYQMLVIIHMDIAIVLWKYKCAGS